MPAVASVVIEILPAAGGVVVPTQGQHWLAWQQNDLAQLPDPVLIYYRPAAGGVLPEHGLRLQRAIGVRDGYVPVDRLVRPGGNPLVATPVHVFPEADSRPAQVVPVVELVLVARSQIGHVPLHVVGARVHFVGLADPVSTDVGGVGDCAVLRALAVEVVVIGAYVIPLAVGVVDDRYVGVEHAVEFADLHLPCVSHVPRGDVTHQFAPVLVDSVHRPTQGVVGPHVEVDVFNLHVVGAIIQIGHLVWIKLHPGAIQLYPEIDIWCTFIPGISPIVIGHSRGNRSECRQYHQDADAQASSFACVARAIHVRPIVRRVIFNDRPLLNTSIRLLLFSGSGPPFDGVS